MEFLEGSNVSPLVADILGQHSLFIKESFLTFLQSMVLPSHGFEPNEAREAAYAEVKIRLQKLQA